MIPKKFLFILFFLLSQLLLIAQDDIYKYKISKDTSLTGRIYGEGHFLSDEESSVVLINNCTKLVKEPTQISILDDNYSVIYKHVFGNGEYQIFKNIHIYDFNNDSFDEIIFSVVKERTIYFYRLDFHNDEVKLENFYQLNIKSSSNMSVRITHVQYDDDKMNEVLITFGSYTYSKMRGKIRGFFIYDFQTNSVLKHVLSAERFLYSTPISFKNGNNSVVVFSTSTSSTSRYRLYFSDSTYFLLNYKTEEIIPYRTNYTEIHATKPDSTKPDYSSDEHAYVRAINNKGNVIWEKRLSSGTLVATGIDSIMYNGKPRVLLTLFNNKPGEKKLKTFLKIIDPITGEILDSTSFKATLQKLLVNKSKIFLSLKNGDFLILDNHLNIIKKTTFDETTSPLFCTTIDNDTFWIGIKGAISRFRSLMILDNNLNRRYSTKISGSIQILEKSQRIVTNFFIENKATIYSIKFVPWYERISAKDFRNLLISILFILLLFMMLWFNTLKVSSKKIRKQKNQLEEKNEELKEATEKLIRAEKLAVYGTIASGIAHEINSPLGAIINSAQRIKKNPTENLEQNINLIEKAGKRSKNIIEKLLVSTRTKSTGETCDVNSVLNDWKEISLKQFSNLGIELRLNILCNDELKISSTELNQIFTNLFFNSRDAIMENGSSEKIISVYSTREENNCIIIVQDTGGGFPDEKLANPYIAFETTKEKGKGTGLGLWVVKNILDRINGGIEITNYEIGAKITITIPINEKIDY